MSDAARNGFAWPEPGAAPPAAAETFASASASALHAPDTFSIVVCFPSHLSLCACIKVPGAGKEVTFEVWGCVALCSVAVLEAQKLRKIGVKTQSHWHPRAGT